MRTASRIVGVAVTAALGLWAVFGTGHAQPPAAGAPANTTLFIIVRVKTGLSESEIRNTLLKGLQLTGCKVNGKTTISKDDVPIKTLPSAFFRDLLQLSGLEGDDTAPAPPSEVGLRELSLSPPVWEVTLASPALNIRKMTVKIKEKAGEKTLDLEPAAPTVKNSPLTLTLPGIYALRLPPDSAFQSAVVEVESLTGGDKKTVEIKDPPNKLDRYYAITLPRFEGNREKLFEAVKVKGEIANPFDDVEIGRELTFTLASVGMRLPRLSDRFFRNKYIPEVYGLPDRETKRVWMLFPLTPDAAKSQAARYQQMSSDELPKEIRKTNPATAATQTLEITPSMQPRWIELTARPGDKNHFSRELTLKDIQGLQNTFPNARRLLVWEFESNNPNVLDKHEAIGFRAADGGRAHVLDEEVTEWPKGIQKTLDETRAPPAKAGPAN